MSSSNDSRYLLGGGLYLQSSKFFLVREPEKWMSLDFAAALPARKGAVFLFCSFSSRSLASYIR